ncbi:hypothetical protein MycrhDRAFT_5739 [Mycolicibacterium rhodesiae JS60]|nr:hypothetical protein MycrhDRAFT_5739 [Mycolicibacterium rhodesiae JS60]
MTRPVSTAVTLVLAVWSFGLSMALGEFYITRAHAEAPRTTMTVDGVDYPVCSEEDCSDQPGQVGLWYSRSTKTWLLELGEDVTLIVGK